MVVSTVNEKIFDIAARKIRQLSEKNPALKKYVGRANIRDAAFRLAKAYGTTKPGVKPGNMNGCSSASCVGESVIDILVRRPRLFTFKEACAILTHCNVDQHIDFVQDTIRKYAIVIVGLPECAKEDLPLAVYFFLEDMFGIQAKLEFCVSVTEEHETNTVGVVFDNIMAKQQIAEKLYILEGADIEIDTYFDINWIIDRLCTD